MDVYGLVRGSLKSVTAIVILLIVSIPCAQAGTETKYLFQLTKGTGTPVCDAYLKRLNTSVYKEPPYCGRPEVDNVSGFAKLNRKALSPDDVRELYPIITKFMGSGNNKAIDWSNIDYQNKLAKKNLGADLTTMKVSFDKGWTKIWYYIPPVDIDNDGVPDNIQIWHGFPVRGVDGRKCGDDISDIVGAGPLLRQPQIAFVITNNSERLDVVKTKNIFGHPKGGYHIVLDGIPTETNDFREAGKSIGIFRFQDFYYFDTFFDNWGDYEGKRRSKSNPEIWNTLAVFLHKDGKTRQICEFQMTDSK